MISNRKIHRGWEYAELGDYHRNLDPNWSYTPTYLQKVKLVDKFVGSLRSGASILDAACGEGVFVEKYHQQGLNIRGIDLNYESDLVQQGNVLKLPFEDEKFDAIFFLDALEHLAFEDQLEGLSEIYRVLKPHGCLLLSVPNLAHLNSRYSLMFKGMLDRTDNELDHLGERPIGENIQLLRQSGFRIVKCTGITLTVPFLYRRVICRKPAQFRWLHDIFEPCARVLPSLAMLSNFICEKID